MYGTRCRSPHIVGNAAVRIFEQSVRDAVYRCIHVFENKRSRTCVPGRIVSRRSERLAAAYSAEYSLVPCGFERRGIVEFFCCRYRIQPVRIYAELQLLTASRIRIVYRIRAREPGNDRKVIVADVENGTVPVRVHAEMFVGIGKRGKRVRQPVRRGDRPAVLIRYGNRRTQSRGGIPVSQFVIGKRSVDVALGQSLLPYSEIGDLHVRGFDVFVPFVIVSHYHQFERIGTRVTVDGICRICHDYRQMIGKKVVLYYRRGCFYLEAHDIAVTVCVILTRQIFKRVFAARSDLRTLALDLHNRDISRYVVLRDRILYYFAHAVPDRVLDVIVARKSRARLRRSRSYVSRIGKHVVSRARDRFSRSRERYRLARSRVLVVESRRRIDIYRIARFVLYDHGGAFCAVIYIIPVVVSHRRAFEDDLNGRDIALRDRDGRHAIVILAFIVAFRYVYHGVARTVEGQIRSIGKLYIYVRARVRLCIFQTEHVASTVYGSFSVLVREGRDGRIGSVCAVEFLCRRSKRYLLGKHEITYLVPLRIHERDHHVLKRIVSQRTVEIGYREIDVVFARVLCRDLCRRALFGSVHVADSKRVFVGLHFVTVLCDYPEVAGIESKRYRAVVVEYLAEEPVIYNVSDVSRKYRVRGYRKLSEIHYIRFGIVLVKREIPAVKYIQIHAVSAVVLYARFVCSASVCQESYRKAYILSAPVTRHYELRLVGA